jgi:hypothetical protein
MLKSQPARKGKGSDLKKFFFSFKGYALIIIFISSIAFFLPFDFVEASFDIEFASTTVQIDISELPEIGYCASSTFLDIGEITLCKSPIDFSTSSYLVYKAPILYFLFLAIVVIFTIYILIAFFKYKYRK